MNTPALQQIYKGSFKDRPRFDGGGYVDYASAGPSAQYYTADDQGGYTSADTGYSPSSPKVSLNAADTAGTQNAPSASGTDVSASPSSVAALDKLVSGNSGSSGSSAAAGALSKILSSLGLGGGNTSNTAALTALTGLLSATGQYKQNQAASKLPSMPAMGALPALPGSSTSGYGPAGGYGYQNYAGATSGLGYAPKAPAKSAPPSYYTYGSGPEQQFFQQVNPAGGQISPVTQHADGGRIHMAVGGAVPPQPPAMPSTMMQRMQAAGGRHQGMPPGGMQAPTQRPQMPPQGAPQSAPQMPARPPVPAQPQQSVPQQSVPQQPVPPQPVPQPAQPGVIPNVPPQQPLAPQNPQVPNGPGGALSRPMMGMADGGTTGTPTFARDQQPVIAPKDMAQSGVLAPQMPGRLSGLPHRATGVNSARPGGSQPMIEQRAEGGALSHSRHITGPGDGTSDSIPARLANGEYVIDSQAVSMLGNGDNSAGARRLDEFRKNLRQHKGASLARGKMAPDAKPIHKYMGGRK